MAGYTYFYTEMPTNLAIDDDLLLEAQRLGKHRSKRDTVTQALIEYVERHRRKHVLDLAGRIDWDPDYDPKALRTRHRHGR